MPPAGHLQIRAGGRFLFVCSGGVDINDAMNWFAPFLARYAFVLLLAAVAMGGVGHRFADPTQDVTELGFAPGDICGGETDSAGALPFCPICVHVATCVMPLPEFAGVVPDFGRALTMTMPPLVQAGLYHSKTPPARGPPVL